MKTYPPLKLTVAALALAFVSNLHAQTAATGGSEPKAAAKTTKLAHASAIDPNAADIGLMDVSITYEAFSLPIAKAGEIQRKGLTDEELHKEFVSAGKLERLLVFSMKSGRLASMENTTYYIYPTEFMMPEIPNPNPRPITLPIAVTAFEKKEVGDTLEVEPTLSSGAKSVDMQVRVSHVVLAKREKWGQGLAEVEQPQFETQKLSTNVTASVGLPRLIGTLNPVFGNGLAARTEQNVWFCFITATVAQNNAAGGKTVK